MTVTEIKDVQVTVTIDQRCPFDNDRDRYQRCPSDSDRDKRCPSDSDRDKRCPSDIDNRSEMSK